MRMFELVPVPVITDFSLAIVYEESAPFYAITFRKHTDTTGKIQSPSLKKKRTQNSAVYCQIRINPSHS